MLPPSPLENVAGVGPGVALEQRPPHALAGLGLSGLPVAQVAASGRDHELALSPAEGVGPRVHALGGNVEYLPRLGAVAQQPPGEVVVVPPGQDDHHGGASAEPVGHGAAPPLPHRVPAVLVVGLGGAAERVVNDHRVCGLADQRRAGRGGLHTAGEPLHAPARDGRPAALGPDAEPPGVLHHVVADRAGGVAREVQAVGRQDEPLVGVDAQLAQHAGPGQGGLALLGRHGQDEPGPAAGAQGGGQLGREQPQGRGGDDAGVQALLERQGVREVRLEAEPAGQLQPGQLARGGHGSALQQQGRAVAQRGAAGPELPA